MRVAGATKFMASVEVSVEIGESSMKEPRLTPALLMRALWILCVSVLGVCISGGDFPWW